MLRKKQELVRSQKSGPSFYLIAPVVGAVLCVLWSALRYEAASISFDDAEFLGKMFGAFVGGLIISSVIVGVIWLLMNGVGWLVRKLKKA